MTFFPFLFPGGGELVIVSCQLSGVRGDNGMRGMNLRQALNRFLHFARPPFLACPCKAPTFVSCKPGALRAGEAGTPNTWQPFGKQWIVSSLISCVFFGSTTTASTPVSSR